MKKKRPQQQVTPPTKGLNIIALKRSASPVEPSEEQPAAVSTEKPEIDAASAPEPVAQNPVDDLAHASCSVSASSPESTQSPVPMDALTKRLEAVEQAISELQSEPPGQLRQESCELAGKLPSTIPEEREPTGELLSEPPNHELTDERPSEQPVLMPNPFPEKGRSVAELAKLTGVTVEQIDQIHLLGDLENWKGGWRAVKKNGEYRYYPLGQLIKSEKSSKK